MGLNCCSNTGYIASVLVYAAFGFLIQFISNLRFLHLKTVDNGDPWFVLCTNPYLQNVLIFMLFPLQHSGLALNMVRDTIKSMTPKGTFGHVYNITSGLVIITMCIGWSPIPVMVWSFSSMPILQYTVTGLSLLCWVALFFTVVLTGPVDNQISEFLRNIILSRLTTPTTVKPGTLITSGIYSVCRHPMVTIYCLALLVHPQMSIGHLMFFLFNVIYVILSVVFLEEPKLLQQFGSEYRDYMKRVPRFIPGVWIL